MHVSFLLNFHHSRFKKSYVLAQYLGPSSSARSLDCSVSPQLQPQPRLVSEARDALVLRPPRLPRRWAPPGRPLTRRVSLADQGSVRGLPRDRLPASAVRRTGGSQTFPRV